MVLDYYHCSQTFTHTKALSLEACMCLGGGGGMKWQSLASYQYKLEVWIICKVSTFTSKSVCCIPALEELWGLLLLPCRTYYKTQETKATTENCTDNKCFTTHSSFSGYMWQSVVTDNTDFSHMKECNTIRKAVPILQCLRYNTIKVKVFTCNMWCLN